MEATLFWTIGVLAVVGLIALIFGMAVIISLWWLLVPLAGAAWGGWFGFFCGIGIVIVLGALKKTLKKKK